MDNKEKAVDTASESIKQQITIASAVIGGTVAFASSLNEAAVVPIWRQLPWALIPLVLAVAFGVAALQCLAFELKAENPTPLSASMVRCFGVLQNIAFVVGFIALVIIVMCN